MLVPRFGSYLLEERYITEAQLRHALLHQRTLRTRRIGEILVDMGVLSLRMLDWVFTTQMLARARTEGYRPPLFGEFLLEQGLVDPTNLQIALSGQRVMRRKLLGEVLVELGYLRPEDLEQAVRAQLAALAVA